MDYARLIKEGRKKKGISLRKLADITGISWMTLHGWENGAEHMRVDKLDAVLKALDISVTIGAERRNHVNT